MQPFVVPDLGSRPGQEVQSTCPGWGLLPCRPDWSVCIKSRIRRADGRIGTRNHIGIFITVNCSAMGVSPGNNAGGLANIIEKVLAIASGEKSKSEALDIGEDEFVPWPIGVLA